MKYTRIDVKNKKKGGGNNNNNNEGKNFIFLFIGVIVIALVISTIMSKFIWPEGKQISEEEKAQTSSLESEKINEDIKDETNPKEDKSEVAPISESKEGQEYVMLQCGFYSNKENADKIKDTLKDDYVAVSLKEGENYRVIVHIGTEEEAISLSDKLSKAGVSNTKSRFKILKEDTCSNEIIEMINGYINIINKLKEDNVKGVKTDEFKSWVNSLEEHKDSKNFKIFKELKEGINKIPEEISKENIEESYQMVFNTLNNFKVNK